MERYEVIISQLILWTYWYHADESQYLLWSTHYYEL